MNKKLLALAIAAALAPAAAMADSGNVKISGNMHVSFDSLNDGTDRNNNVSSNNSYITFSGDEALGNGLKAVWQVTGLVGMGKTGNGDGTLGSGNTYAGLGGGFGTVILGRHDTPLKLVGRKVDLFADQIGDNRNLTGMAVSPSTAGVTTNYVGDLGGVGDLRADNVVAYISPNFSGFSAIVAHVTNVNDNSYYGSTIPTGYTTIGNAATTNTSINAWSASGMYESGPVMVGLAYEKHNFSRLSSAAKDPSEYRLVGGYNFGDVKVVGLYQKSSNLVGMDNIDRKVWGLGAAYKIGSGTIKGQYYSAADVTGCGVVDCSKTGANMIAVGYDYSLSKRTTVYAAYAKVSNQDEAAFNPFGGGHGDNPGTSFDRTTFVTKDPSALSFGMKHSF